MTKEGQRLAPGFGLPSIFMVAVTALAPACSGDSRGPDDTGSYRGDFFAYQGDQPLAMEPDQSARVVTRFTGARLEIRISIFSEYIGGLIGLVVQFELGDEPVVGETVEVRGEAALTGPAGCAPDVEYIDHTGGTVISSAAAWAQMSLCSDDQSLRQLVAGQLTFTSIGGDDAHGSLDLVVDPIFSDPSSWQAPQGEVRFFGEF